MKKWLTTCAAAFLAGGICLGSASAEVNEVEEFTYEEMIIQVMPEFDYPDEWPEEEPSLLNAFYGTLKNTGNEDFTGEIEFPVPLDEKGFAVYLVADFPADSQSEVQVSYELDETNKILKWKPSSVIKAGESYQFVVEYYSSPMNVSGNEKKFDFFYQAPSAINNMNVIIFNPINSTEFAVDKPADQVSESDYGQELHYYEYKDVKTGDDFSYGISYTKEGNESSLSAISKMEPPNDDTHGGIGGEASSGDKAAPAGTAPVISTEGAVIIGISILASGVFVYFGLRGRNKMNHTKSQGKKAVKKQKDDPNETRKKLRSMLMEGKIDEATYKERMKKLI